ncbi:hypothetical protein IWQ62_000792 [Dispira parvispora]|uniref:Uncharacterized protein n=1 Tax=Dispira parvispora TaxID=1520584 RepID=A0A9W8E8V2_9FUNG|nr:hypothetical protein IWQ62_000792 [Dispira parvispora]
MSGLTRKESRIATLEHISKLSHEAVNISPVLARFYGMKAQQLVKELDLTLPDAIKRTMCQACGAFLVPNVTCSFALKPATKVLRLKPKRKRRKLRDQEKDSQSTSEQSDPPVLFTHQDKHANTPTCHNRPNTILVSTTYLREKSWVKTQPEAIPDSVGSFMGIPKVNRKQNGTFHDVKLFQVFTCHACQTATCIPATFKNATSAADPLTTHPDTSQIPSSSLSNPADSSSRPTNPSTLLSKRQRLRQPGAYSYTVNRNPKPAAPAVAKKPTSKRSGLTINNLRDILKKDQERRELNKSQTSMGLDDFLSTL